MRSRNAINAGHKTVNSVDFPQKIHEICLYEPNEETPLTVVQRPMRFTFNGLKIIVRHEQPHVLGISTGDVEMKRSKGQLP